MKSINFLKVVLLTFALLIGYTVATYAQTCTPRFVSSSVNGKRGTLTGMPTQLYLPTFGGGVDTFNVAPNAYLNYIRVLATDSLQLIISSNSLAAEGDQIVVSFFASGGARKLRFRTTQFTLIGGTTIGSNNIHTVSSGEAIVFTFRYNCADAKWIQVKGN